MRELSRCMMRLSKRTLILILLLILAIFVIPQPIEASSATSYTLTLNAKDQFVRTQDAYLPLRTTMELELSAPEDMIFDADGYLWIADTGNLRVVKYDTFTNELLYELTYPEFLAPKGIFINSRGIYVADSAARAVFRFDVNGNFIEKFSRPTSVSFGETS